MSDYSFDILTSFWYPFFCAIAGFFVAWLSYRRTLPPISQRRKAVVITLRGLALSLLMFLLFEPTLSLLRVEEEPPRIAILLDNSRSMSITDASINRKEQYSTAIERLLSLLSPDEADIFVFDKETTLVPQFSLDSLTWQGEATNISKAVAGASAATDRRNIRAFFLMSDGAVNAGENPIYNVEKTGKPFFTIGIGDSTAPKDIAIQGILANEVAYLNTILPISVNFTAAGYSGETLRFALMSEGKVIETQEVKLSDAAAFVSETVNFRWRPDKAGTAKITVDVEELEGELTAQNNTSSTFVKVLENKRSVALLAGAPSPDVAFFTSFLNTDDEVKVEQFIQKQGAEFFTEPHAEALANAEVIALVGFPIASTPPRAIELVKEQAERGKPLLFVASKDTDYSKLSPLMPYLPFTVTQAGTQEMIVLADVQQKALSHPLMKLENTDGDLDRWNALPPIYKTETFIKARPEAEVLATIKINNTALNEPLIIAGTTLNRRTVAILGYGLFRWRLLGYAADVAKNRPDAFDVLTTFFQNNLRWLAADKQGKRVRIRTNENIYSAGEEVQILGQVYDASYNPVEDAEVRVIIKDSAGAERSVLLTSLGTGRYFAGVEGLPAGEYYYSGVAEDNTKRTLGSDEGRFSVGETSLEFINQRMNAPLMSLLAQRSGGQFAAPEDLESVIATIRQMPTFKARPVQFKETLPLRTMAWILACIVGLLAAEWIIRKRGGLL